MEVNSDIKFSVIIPLYNKRDEIERAVRSAVEQSYSPLEVIVVDDGSTDGSAEIVRGIESPLVKLVTQPNGGVCVARNRAIAEASGEYIAMLDADDWWDRDFLAEIKSLIEEYPNCGIYSTSHRIVKRERVFEIENYPTRGIVSDFFVQSMKYTICLPSLCVVPKRVLDRLGAFPVGMKLGEDQYLWVKIASQYSVCYSPKRCANYSISASNRSSSIFVEESCDASFDEFYNPNGDRARNEYIARCSIGKAITIAAKGGVMYPKHVEKFYSYTQHYRLGLWKLRVLNRLPIRLRWSMLVFYNRMAWLIARKGTL